MLKKDFLDQILGMWGLFVGKCLSPVPWENRVALHLQGESRVEIAGLGTPFHRQTLCHMQCPGSCMVVGQIVYGQNGRHLRTVKMESYVRLPFHDLLPALEPTFAGKWGTASLGNVHLVD